MLGTRAPISLQLCLIGVLSNMRNGEREERKAGQGKEFHLCSILNEKLMNCSCEPVPPTWVSPAEKGCDCPADGSTDHYFGSNCQLCSQHPQAAQLWQCSPLMGITLVKPEVCVTRVAATVPGMRTPLQEAWPGLHHLHRAVAHCPPPGSWRLVISSGAQLRSPRHEQEFHINLFQCSYPLGV